MGEGMALVIAGVEEKVDPMLNPLLEKTILKKDARSISILEISYASITRSLVLYLTTRLPNLHFSPELQARLWW